MLDVIIKYIELFYPQPQSMVMVFAYKIIVDLAQGLTFLANSILIENYIIHIDSFS